MSSAWRPRGLQFEITANLFVVMLAGLAIVAVVGASLFTQGVVRSAFERLESDARYLVQLQTTQPKRLPDLAAQLALFSSGSVYDWRVLDAAGRGVGFNPGVLRVGPELRDAIRASLAGGKSVQFGSAFDTDLVLLVPVSSGNGRSGLLVGSLSEENLRSRIWPELKLGLWVLLTAATVFVLFGAYLLRWRIVRPVQILETATQNIASGRFDTRIPSGGSGGSDELASLAQSFNQMADSLQRERRALIEAQESVSRNQRLASVGQLAAGVAHEVGNPVSAILSYSEVLLRDQNLSDQSRQVSDRIKNEALRVRVLVRDLLDLSRSERADCQTVDPSTLLARIAERLKAQKLLDGISLELDIAADLPPISTDAARIEQIVTNLVENAAHELEGSGDPWIFLGAERGSMPSHPARRRDDDGGGARQAFEQPKALIICVRDNGRGIDESVAPHVFDPFFTTKEQGKGTGLGLWNAHRLAELLGGCIRLESRPGNTCFSLFLPTADTASERVSPPRRAT